MSDGEHEGGGEYRIPDDVLKELDSIDERAFWEPESLAYFFEKDLTFGMKIWGGLMEILEQAGVEKQTIEQYNKKSEAMLRATTDPIQAAVILLELRNWIVDDCHVPMADLSAREIMRAAYVSEARAMVEMGIDPNENPPFSVTVGINKDHPAVKESMGQEGRTQIQKGGEMLDRLIEKSPSFKRKLGAL